MTERWPEHYNDTANHFKRRFNNLASDIYERVLMYENRPNAVDIDPNHDEPDDEDVYGSDGEVPEF